MGMMFKLMLGLLAAALVVIEMFRWYRKGYDEGFDDGYEDAVKEMVEKVK